MKLIIIRGPSGSGKSTIARHLSETEHENISFPIHEADAFFMNPLSYFIGDEYKFDANLLGAAHRTCQLGAERDMFHQLQLVIVSNTSIRMKEMLPYLELAVKYNYEVEIIRTPGPWTVEDSAARNIHGVPVETLRKQIERYVEHLDEIEWSDMTIFK